MVFTKRLREVVRRGEITRSVYIWKYPHVKIGNRYKMEEKPVTTKPSLTFSQPGDNEPRAAR